MTDKIYVVQGSYAINTYTERNPMRNPVTPKSFIEEILKTEKLYFIAHPEKGVFVCDSNEFCDAETEEPLAVFPLWTEAYLPVGKTYMSQGEDSKELVMEEISFIEFYNEMLPELEEEGLVIGLNWDQTGNGTEVSAEEFFDELDSHLDAVGEETKV